MLIAFKALGATCLAGALAASGVLTSDVAGHSQTEGPTTTTLVSDPHATFETLAVGEQKEVSADEAGSATVTRTDAGLEVAAVAPAAGWTAATKTLAPDWLLITFAGPSRQIDLSLDIAGDNLRIRKAAFDVAVTTTTTTEPPTTTTTEPPTTTTTTEPPTTTTTPPLPPTVVTLPPPVQPTVIPVAGAGTVVIVLQGPVAIVRQVNALPGWIASVERRSGDVDVLFRNGDRSFRFFASMADRRMTSAIREVRADGGDHHGGGHRGKG
jgi:hypothetical protein